MLGLATLVISFVVLFYMPIVYFWVKANQAKKRKQNN
jgi:preprotein translocase subunit YajC